MTTTGSDLHRCMNAHTIKVSIRFRPNRFEVSRNPDSDWQTSSMFSILNSFLSFAIQFLERWTDGWGWAQWQWHIDKTMYILSSNQSIIFSQTDKPTDERTDMVSETNFQQTNIRKTRLRCKIFPHAQSKGSSFYQT